MAVWVCACSAAVTNHDTAHIEHFVERGPAAQLRANLDVGLSDLTVRGGECELMEAQFRVSGQRSPKVDYKVRSGVGTLNVRGQGGGDSSSWDVCLNNSLPTELVVDSGVGDTNLELARMELRSLRVDTGTGDLVLDLSGTPTHDLKVQIDAGVGDTTVRLPKDVGIQVTIDKGVGDVNAGDLQRVGNTWRSENFESASVKVHIDIDAGVGDVRLR